MTDTELGNTPKTKTSCSFANESLCCARLTQVRERSKANLMRWICQPILEVGRHSLTAVIDRAAGRHM